MIENLADFQKIGLAGLPLLAFVLYQIYRLWKGDSKTDKTDARIDAYAQNLQMTIDKLVKKLEDLGALKDQLVTQNALFAAQLEIAKAEVKQMQESKDRLIERVKYLEGLLKEKGVTYAA